MKRPLEALLEKYGHKSDALHRSFVKGKGDSKFLKQLTPEMLVTEDYWGQTILGDAVEGGYIKAFGVVLLKQLTPEMLLKEDHLGHTILCYAALEGCIKDFGPDLLNKLTPDMVLKMNKNGVSLLSALASKHQLKIFSPGFLSELIPNTLAESDNKGESAYQVDAMEVFFKTARYYENYVWGNILKQIEHIKTNVTSLCINEIKHNLDGMGISKFTLYNASLG